MMYILKINISVCDMDVYMTDTAGFQLAIRDSQFATRFRLFTNHFSRMKIKYNIVRQNNIFYIMNLIILINTSN